MQYVSGVWQSLTGHTVAKRKRSEEDAAALPDRMTSLKLHADQNPGNLQCAFSSATLPDSSCDVGSSVASGSHFHAVTSSLHHVYSTRAHTSYPSLAPNSVPKAAIWSTVPQQAEPMSHTISLPSSVTKTVNLNRNPATHNTAASGSEYSNLPTAYTHHTDLRYEQATSRQGTTERQHLLHSLKSESLPAAASIADADLSCNEAFSPEAWRDIPSQPSLYSPDMALSESVADSPDDIEVLEDEVTQPNSPFVSLNTAAAFLAVCQSPQVTTALSKLHSCHDLPSGCIMLPLPMTVQVCSIAMATELQTAASAQARWNIASQLDWTVAAMFALYQRAKLCEQELDSIMLLSILWILGNMLQVLAFAGDVHFLVDAYTVVMQATSLIAVYWIMACIANACASVHRC